MGSGGKFSGAWAELGKKNKLRNSCDNISDKARLGGRGAPHPDIKLFSLSLAQLSPYLFYSFPKKNGSKKTDAKRRQEFHQNLLDVVNFTTFSEETDVCAKKGVEEVTKNVSGDC